MIGTDIIRYDIYGRNVRIANKIEKYGKEGRIVISQKTKELLEEHFPETYSYKNYINLVFSEEEMQTYKVAK